MNKFFFSAICYFIINGLVSCGINKNNHGVSFEADTTVTRLSVLPKLKEVDHLPIAERIAFYHKLKNDSSSKYNFLNEQELTMYGYSLLWNNKTTDAIEVFKLILSEFPNSANAYDNLGEGYFQDKNMELSLLNYEKSLAMNPANFNAEDYIERIKFPGRIPPTPAEKFVKVYTAAAYRSDLDQLGETLMKVHPNALKFITKNELLKVVASKKALINDSTTYAEFAWHCNEIIAAVKCSHTNAGGFFFENQMIPLSLKFPLQTRWVNDKLYIIDLYNNNEKIKIKDEIVSINGVLVPELIKDIYNHIPSQGFIQTTKKHFFNRWSTGLIAYALSFPEKYTVVVKGNAQPVVLNTAITSKDPYQDGSIERCRTRLCLQMKENKTAVLTISSFNYYPWADLSVFKNFIDSSFLVINKTGIKDLIIDARFNTGGSQQSSIHLLRYLIDKPFIYYSRADFPGKTEKIDGEESVAPFRNRYKGNLYFIMDGNGNSTTGHFMSMVKIFSLGTIVGEECGSNQFCSAGQTICRLSNTKLEYYVADNTHITTATSLPDETGILPDHYVTQNIEEYLNKIDVVKNYTLNLIKNRN